jgi:hypothetical protein
VFDWTDAVPVGRQYEAVSRGDGALAVAARERCRAVHNGLIDRRPGLIARCHIVADVRDAVAFGRDAGLEIRSAAAGTTWPAGPSPTAA